MKNVSINIEQLGFNKWFFDKIDLTKLINYQIARVTTVNKDSYTINNGKGEVAAEITGLIVQSLDNNYNLRRLERYLVMIIQSNIQPVVLLSKSDLLPVSEVDKKVDEIHALNPDIRVLPFSNEDNTNLKRVKELLVPRFNKELPVIGLKDLQLFRLLIPFGYFSCSHINLPPY